MDEQRKETWRKCLILWEALSIKPTTKIDSSISPKIVLVKSLGFGHQLLGCPLCEVYFDKRKCKLCPIKSKLNHEDVEVPCRNKNCPYRQYSDMTLDQNVHDEKLAELFYVWLIKLAKEEGYEPDFNLKYW